MLRRRLLVVVFVLLLPYLRQDQASACPNPDVPHRRRLDPFRCSQTDAQLQHLLVGVHTRCVNASAANRTVMSWPASVATPYGSGLVARAKSSSFNPISSIPSCPSQGERPDRCRVWIKKEFWTMASRWYRRVHVDDTGADGTVDEAAMTEKTAWGVAFRTGLEREPALWHDDRIFIPSHYLPFVRLECQVVHPHDEGQEGMVQSDMSSVDFRSAREMAARKVITVGDLHGDLWQTARTFLMAGVIDEEGHWAGGSKTIFVQTGDIVDRGPDTIALFGFLEQLKEEAFAAGGEYIQIMGNHEMMNIGGDLRFVSPEDVASFGTAELRRLAFRASGFIGRHLFRLPLVHRVGRTVFAHGGVSEKFSDRGVRGINEFKDAMVDEFVKETDAFKQYTRWPMFGEEGPLWFRGFAEMPEVQICPQLRRVLRSLGADRMIVGHTVQFSGRVLVRCDTRFIVTDVGISRVYGGNVAAVEISEENDGRQVWAIYEQGRELISDGMTF